MKKEEEVEAYVASWIEISAAKYIIKDIEVEAYVASWIEISIVCSLTQSVIVEAYVASWIEIVSQASDKPFLSSRLT